MNNEKWSLSKNNNDVKSQQKFRQIAPTTWGVKNTLFSYFILHFWGHQFIFHTSLKQLVSGLMQTLWQHSTFLDTMPSFWSHVLCISTSKWVLRIPSSGQNHFFLLLNLIVLSWLWLCKLHWVWKIQMKRPLIFFMCKKSSGFQITLTSEKNLLRDTFIGQELNLVKHFSKIQFPNQFKGNEATNLMNTITSHLICQK